ncbi:hypothetical protein [Pseudomonas vranovensis]|uniref:hypothetical protein n=1 Tax=Pseudomonas vranovensis TaxID=321661 RepID=UPI003D96E593
MGEIAATLPGRRGEKISMYGRAKICVDSFGIKNQFVAGEKAIAVKSATEVRSDTSA